MASITPKHISFEQQNKMSLKSKVFALETMLANEAKYEDCLTIMDNYERVLQELFIKAHGN